MIATCPADDPASSLISLARLGSPLTAGTPAKDATATRERRRVEDLANLSDEALIRRSRDEPALASRCLDALFERIYPRLANWCMRYCRDADEAADLAQEVVMRAYTRLDSFRFESRFSTWIYTISRRVAIDRGIARQRDESRKMPGEAAEELEDPASTSAVAELESVGDAVRDAMLDDLDPLEARVVYLHYVDGMSLPAITQLLDCRNKSGAKAYLVGGMRKLRKRFKHTAQNEDTIV